MTDRVPEVVQMVLALPVEAVVLDGEAIALKEDGSPHRFQVTMSRFGSKADAASRSMLPLSTFFFDVLHVDGDDLVDRPARERLAILERPPCRESCSAGRGGDRSRERSSSWPMRSNTATRA